MIKKILRIADFRLFQAWSSEAGARDFARVNLIYGVNGSGKSTLVTLLAQAPHDNGWKSGLRVTMLNADGTTSTVSTPDAELWKSIRVFNRAYVTTNLKFDLDGESTTQPLLILGQKNIDKTEQTAVVTKRLEEIQVDLPTYRRKNQAGSRAAEELASRTATLIVQELSQLGGRYAARSYNARQVKQLLAQPPAEGAADVSAELDTVRADGLEQLPIVEDRVVSLEPLQVAVAELLSQKAVSIAIPALREDQSKASWVQEGLGLHHADDDCLFCGNPVTGERLEELERHFDDSLKKLQVEVTTVLSRIDNATSSVTHRIADLPDVAHLAPSLRPDYEAAVDLSTQQSTAVLERLSALRAAVEDKRSHLFTASELGDDLPGHSAVDLANVMRILERHNELSSSQGTVRAKAAKKLEVSRVEAVRTDYERFSEDAADAAETVAQLTEEQQNLEGRLRELAQQDMDATPLAESLNEDLARLLGRDDLVFSLGDDGYTIRRAGKPALYLSEGEKTAISLLYFLKSLDAHDCDRENTIVVIDDPVSSLDSNVVAGVSAHLWARLVGRGKCRQLFLFTHSFELFRSWGNLLDRLRDPARSLEDITETTQELRVRMVINPDGTVGRQPFLMSWPDNKAERNRIRSEYHYLFWRVASTLQECQTDPTPNKELDAAAVLPNVCRRMLEAFLSFKYPDKVGDFRGMVEAAIGTIDNSVTRTRLVTYLHQYSHNEEGDISRPVARPESISMLGAVFDLIRTVDSEHYEKMCSSLGVHPQLVTF